MEPHMKGTLIVLFGVLWFTPDSLSIKLIGDDNGLSIAFYRMSFYSAVTAAGLLALHSRHPRQYGLAPAAAKPTAAPPGLRAGVRSLLSNLAATGWVGVMVGLFQACMETFFCLAQAHTTSANVLVVLSSSPLWSALLSRAVLGERLPWYTIGAIGLGVSSVAYVFARELHDDGGGDGEDKNTALGLVFALCTSLSMSSQFVTIRHGTGLQGQVAVRVDGRDLTVADMDGHYVVALPIGSLAVLPLLYGLGARPEHTGAEDVGWMAIGGAVILPVSLTALTVGPAYIPAAEVSLLMLLETVVGPLWVWVGVGESPSVHTVTGGAVLILVLAMHAVLGWQSEQRRRAPAVAAAVRPAEGVL